MTCCQKDRERGELGILVFNKANEIIMHSVDYKEFNLEELAGLARTSAATHVALGPGSLRRAVEYVCAHAHTSSYCAYAHMHSCMEM